MAKGVYVGINNIARKIPKIYVGVDGIARKVKRVYIGVDNKARLCFDFGKKRVKVNYISNLTLNATQRELNVGEPYGTMPITPRGELLTAPGRVDFWFYPNAKAQHDSSKPYKTNPWCAYADVNPTLYSQYGYAKDLLAKHWRETGEPNGWNLGGVTPSTICENEEEHNLEHAYQISGVVLECGSTVSGLVTDKTWCDVYSSTGSLIFSVKGEDVLGETDRVHPGMTIQFHARHQSGILNVGSDGSACWVTLNGQKVSGRGTYTYTVPENIKTITASITTDNHYDGGMSWQIAVTTTAWDPDTDGWPY